MRLQRHINKRWAWDRFVRDQIDAKSGALKVFKAINAYTSNGYETSPAPENAIEPNPADTDQGKGNSDRADQPKDKWTNWVADWRERLKHPSSDQLASPLQEGSYWNSDTRWAWSVPRHRHEMNQSNPVGADMLRMEWSPRLEVPSMNEMRYVCGCCGWFGRHDETKHRICWRCGEANRIHEDEHCRCGCRIDVEDGSPACPRCKIERLHCTSNPFDLLNNVVRRTSSKDHFTDMELNCGITAAAITYRFWRGHHKKIEREELEARKAAEHKALLEEMLVEATW